MTRTRRRLLKGSWWAAAAFYGLIAFEFFYMASPFALYFYSIYKPGLNLLARFPQLDWLLAFFLPHIVVDTACPVIDLHNMAGIVLAARGGLIFFLAGAGQIYLAKLRKKGAVTGGIYRLVRHPQYTALIVSGLGFLLLWPRYLAVIVYAVMVFIYVLLALVEEAECLRRYGEPYERYRAETGMFLPLLLPPALRYEPRSRMARAISMAVLLVLLVGGSLGLARLSQHHLVDSLHGVYTDTSATMSVGEMDPARIERLVSAARSSEEVAVKLEEAGWGSGARFVNYVMPADWYISEIPMDLAGGSGGHAMSRDHSDTYKIVFTRSSLDPDRDVRGREILIASTRRTPVAEVWVGPSGEVIRILDPPAKVPYEGVPVPIY